MTKLIILTLAIIGLLSSLLQAQNPIVPPGVYIADPAAQVWDDGRLYIYGSVDESTDYYCSRKYHVLSTGDMLQWTLHENSFASAGEGDAIDYNDNLLFAPDCMYRNGKYYLYYCQPDRDHAEGVAVSKHPAGPFKKGKPMDTGGHNQIDPGVFIDDDGEAYYLWGQFTLKMGRLKPNMKELEPGSIRDSVLTEWDHFFHEGAYMTKRNGIYYLVYADMSRGNMPTCIGYATSNAPMGPYTYRGVIIDNDHSDPGCWNNHGSIASWNDRWYVFYHRSTHNSRMMRKACVEPITFLADGTIPEVEMTTQGAGPALDPTLTLEAERACWMFGNVRVEGTGEGEEALGRIQHDDRVVYKYLKFSGTERSVSLRMKPGKHKGSIQLRLDQPWGEQVAWMEVPESGGEEEWILQTADISPVTGTRALWLVFYGDRESDDFGCSVDWLRFE